LSANGTAYAWYKKEIITKSETTGNLCMRNGQYLDVEAEIRSHHMGEGDYAVNV
jgi:hypothetical protein